MKRIIILIFALMPIWTSGQVKFQEIAIEKAFERAKKENKGLVLDIISNKVDNENIEKVLQDKQTSSQLLENFIPVRLSLMKTENMEFFTEYIRNLSTPVLVFMNQDKKILTAGYWDEMAAGRQHFNQVLAAAIKESVVKKTNTKHINFLDIDYSQALEQSKTTGKPIFIDCYFIGCGPCKRMDDNVFTLDMVADFYNQNFICIKLDRAKDEQEVLKKYKVFAFPAYLYIKSTGDLILKEDGFRPADEFIALGNKAMKMFSTGTAMSDQPAATDEANAAPASSTSFGASSASVPAAASSPATTETSGGSTAAATEGGVHFEKLSLNEALAKAKSENKAIYVDMSATWCQPCKRMKQDVFPNPDVVKYLNDNYISIAFDCDVDSALSNEFRDKYYTTAFPTHLLIDQKGDLIHKFVGYLKVPTFLEELLKGVVSDKGLASFNKRYSNGERSADFMNEYITMLANANEGERASGLASEYLNTLPLESLTNRKTFYLINEFVRDLDGDLAKKVLANKTLFEKNISKEEVAEYQNKLWILKGLSYVHKVDNKNVLDKTGFDTFLKRLEASKIDKSGYVRSTCIMENNSNTSDWNTYVNFAISYMKKNKGKASPMLTWNWGARLENNCKEKELRLKYVEELESNFNLVKKSDAEQAIIWVPSMKDLFAKLKN